MDSAGAIWRDEESESPIWHFTALRSRMGSAQFAMDMAQLQDVRTKQLEGGQAHWGWKEMPPKKKDDDLLYRVSCEAVAGDTLFVITITYPPPGTPGGYL